MSVENLTIQEARESPTFVADRLSQEQREALIGEPLPEARGVSTTKEIDIEYRGKPKDRWYIKLIKNSGEFLYYLARA